MLPTPLRQKLLIRPRRQKQAGSFIIPDAYGSKHADIGVIEAVDPEQDFFEPGDLVTFLPWQATTFPLENPYDSFDDSVYVLHEEQIEAIIETEGDSFRILPAGDRVVVYPDEPEIERIILPFGRRSTEALLRKERSHGFYLPASGSSAPCTGRLVSCGPLVRDLRPTQRVLFSPGDPILNNLSRSRDHGIELEVAGRKFFIFRESEIFAVLV